MSSTRSEVVVRQVQREAGATAVAGPHLSLPSETTSLTKTVLMRSNSKGGFVSLGPRLSVAKSDFPLMGAEHFRTRQFRFPLKS